MKKNIPFFLTLALAFTQTGAGRAQSLVPHTVTVFKNNKSLVYKSGKVLARDKRWSTNELPDALFGTFWIASPANDLASVFSRQDSVDLYANDNACLLEANPGKQVTLWINQYSNAPVAVSGVVEKILSLHSLGQPANGQRVYLRTNTGRWQIFDAAQITQIEFLEKPSLDCTTLLPWKRTQKSLEVRFKSDKAEQEISMLYLTGGIGWTPVYSLILNNQGKNRLSLRAQIANNAEDLNNAELRLAVGIPNFRFGDRPDWMVDFAHQWQLPGTEQYYLSSQQSLRSNYIRSQEYSPDETVVTDADGENFAGAQAEDYYFYTVRPGNFPKNSRYQYPIFEADVEPVHFYECRLEAAAPSFFIRPYEQVRRPEENKNPVSHFVEFANPTQFPFTTGAVNMLSQTGGSIFPLSQDKLPYTPPGAKCKVKIAETPEIKVTHGEGDVERKDDIFRFFNNSYDEVKVEAQVAVVNYKKEAVTLKIRRSMEGTPVASELRWETRQEQATLRANPSFELEWTVELKPGEEKKWKYSYRVYVDM